MFLKRDTRRGTKKVVVEEQVLRRMREGRAVLFKLDEKIDNLC